MQRLIAVALLTTVVAGCGSNYHEVQGQAVPVAEAATESAAPEEGTKSTVLLPVDAVGNPARGWSITPDPHGYPIDCSDPNPSPSALSDDVLHCFPNAAAADTCFASAEPGYALCLVDPFTNEVVEYAVEGAFAEAAAPDDPRPIALILDNGDRCRLRVGGAWSAPASAPDYAGHYSCRGLEGAAIWGLPNGDGINQSPEMWTVEYGGFSGPLTTQRVVEAFYTGRAE